MQTLNSEETFLKGRWELKDGIVSGDIICLRIGWLISEYLMKSAQDETGWLTLYIDPSDGRYWELSYPESELSGGGPPQLENISSIRAEEIYGVNEANGEVDGE